MTIPSDLSENVCKPILHRVSCLLRQYNDLNRKLTTVSSKSPLNIIIIHFCVFVAIRHRLHHRGSIGNAGAISVSADLLWVLRLSLAMLLNNALLVSAAARSSRADGNEVEHVEFESTTVACRNLSSCIVV